MAYDPVWLESRNAHRLHRLSTMGFAKPPKNHSEPGCQLLLQALHHVGRSHLQPASQQARNVIGIGNRFVLCSCHHIKDQPLVCKYADQDNADLRAPPVSACLILLRLTHAPISALGKPKGRKNSGRARSKNIARYSLVNPS
jgi:hypothetical protein